MYLLWVAKLGSNLTCTCGLNARVSHANDSLEDVKLFSVEACQGKLPVSIHSHQAWAKQSLVGLSPDRAVSQDNAAEDLGPCFPLWAPLAKLSRLLSQQLQDRVPADGPSSLQAPGGTVLTLVFYFRSGLRSEHHVPSLQGVNKALMDTDDFVWSKKSKKGVKIQSPCKNIYCKKYSCEH